MNKVNLIGRMTRDPEVRYTQSNKAVANFSIAVDRRYKTDGAEVDFINIVAWDKTAEFVQKYFGKGVRIGVSGRIQISSYQTPEGQQRQKFEVVAEEVCFADGKQAKTAAPEDDGFYPIEDE